MPEPVYPTYAIEQPDYETEPVCVVTVNKPNSQVDQSEELLKKLLEVLTPKSPPPVRVPDVTPLEKLVQLFLSETAKRELAPRRPWLSLRGYKHYCKRTLQGSNHQHRGPGSDKYDVTGLM